MSQSLTPPIKLTDDELRERLKIAIDQAFVSSMHRDRRDELQFEFQRRSLKP